MLVYKQILLVLLSYITTTDATAIITINVSGSITNFFYATYLLFKPLLRSILNTNNIYFVIKSCLISVTEKFQDI